MKRRDKIEDIKKRLKDSDQGRKYVNVHILVQDLEYLIEYVEDLKRLLGKFMIVKESKRKLK